MERVAPVLEFVRRVDRPNVGLTFDVGHAFLAAHYFGFDYLKAVQAAHPLLIHLHVTDNFGRFDPLRLENFTLYRTQRPRDILPVGRGDLHLPVGWGAIPYEETFARLRGYRGTVITEYRYTTSSARTRPVWLTNCGCWSGCLPAKTCRRHSSTYSLPCRVDAVRCEATHLAVEWPG